MPAALELFGHLGRGGILARRFAEQAAWLRFGLPASEPEWHRLAAALAAFEGSSLTVPRCLPSKRSRKIAGAGA